MKKISVITPTIRKEGLNLVRKSLKNQTFTDFEWIICSPFYPEIEEAKWMNDNFEGGFWTLNRAYKSMIDVSEGEYIVSWQDWIYAKPDMLERLISNAERTGGLVSPVGDQYGHLDEHGKPCNVVWRDPRKTDKYGTFYEVTFPDIEWNLCICPKKVFEETPVDTQMDFLGYGMDMYQINERLNDKGYKFYIDQSLESYTLRHGRERSDWDEKHLMHGGYEKRKKELKKQGKW